jgi:hypothetical protein
LLGNVWYEGSCFTPYAVKKNLSLALLKMGKKFARNMLKLILEINKTVIVASIGVPY